MKHNCKLMCKHKIVYIKQNVGTELISYILYLYLTLTFQGVEIILNKCSRLKLGRCGRVTLCNKVMFIGTSDRLSCVA